MTPGKVRMQSNGRIWFVAGAVFCVLGAVYYFADPMVSKWFPRCLFHTVTGLDCPGCGAQRMAHALLHGDFRTAWHSNAFLLCMIPVLGAGIWADLRPGFLRRLFQNPVTLWSLTVALVLWTVLRNVC